MEGQFYVAAVQIVDRLKLVDESEIRQQIKQLIDVLSENGHCICFGEAVDIDKRFGGIDSDIPNGFWRQAYGYPSNGYNVHGDKKFIAQNCGIFTCDIDYIVIDNDADNQDDVDQTNQDDVDQTNQDDVDQTNQDDVDQTEHKFDDIVEKFIQSRC